MAKDGGFYATGRARGLDELRGAMVKAGLRLGAPGGDRHGAAWGDVLGKQAEAAPGMPPPPTTTEGGGFADKIKATAGGALEKGKEMAASAKTKFHESAEAARHQFERGAGQAGKAVGEHPYAVGAAGGAAGTLGLWGLSHLLSRHRHHDDEDGSHRFSGYMGKESAWPPLTTPESRREAALRARRKMAEGPAADFPGNGGSDLIAPLPPAPVHAEGEASGGEVPREEGEKGPHLTTAQHPEPKPESWGEWADHNKWGLGLGGLGALGAYGAYRWLSDPNERDEHERRREIVLG